jgi:hypothetical protein
MEFSSNFGWRKIKFWVKIRLFYDGLDESSVLDPNIQSRAALIWPDGPLKISSIESMERLDQGYLHPLLEHPETNMSRPGIDPGPPASEAITSKELSEQPDKKLFGTSTVPISAIPVENVRDKS